MAKKTRRARKVRRTHRRESKRMTTTTTSKSDENEFHHYSAKMMFDGKKLVSEIQKNNEPAQRRVYTLKQLAREIPLAAELGKAHLGWNDRAVIQYPPTPKNLDFQSVLPNPSDLGLMPPNHHHHHHKTTRRRMKMRQALPPPTLYSEPWNAGEDAGEDADIQLNVQDKDYSQPRNLFDLPVASRNYT
jgi:hypothetical protein